MTEPIIPPALDAYATAKPDEPTFTLQGGDPLAPFCVLQWANLARWLAGDISLCTIADQSLEALKKITPPHVPSEQRELRLRAKSAEEVAWEMQAYQRNVPCYSPNLTVHYAEPGDDVTARLIVHEKLVSCTRKLDNSIAEIFEVCEILADLDPEHPSILPLSVLLPTIRGASNLIRPQRTIQPNPQKSSPLVENT